MVYFSTSERNNGDFFIFSRFKIDPSKFNRSQSRKSIYLSSRILFSRMRYQCFFNSSYHEQKSVYNLPLQMVESIIERGISYYIYFDITGRSGSSNRTLQSSPEKVIFRVGFGELLLLAEFKTEPFVLQYNLNQCKVKAKMRLFYYHMN